MRILFCGEMEIKNEKKRVLQKEQGSGTLKIS
jgi:hypothetical protein